MSIPLREYQQEALEAIDTAHDRGVRRQLISHATGLGKGHPLTTEVPTPQGWKKWGDLTPGDEVFSSAGTPITVTNVFDRGVLPTYRVCFSDGSSLDTDADHLWSVRDMKHRGNSGEYCTVSTAEMLRQGLRYRPYRRWSVPLTAVEYPHASLPIGPYTMGALLANGYLCGVGTQLTTPDDQVADLVSAEHAINRIQSTEPDTWCARYSIPGLCPAIRELGINVRSAEKFIPDPYQGSSIEQRTALLRGLMDGDGSSRGGGRRSAVYHTTSSRLADDVRALVLSLGGTASTRSYPRTSPKGRKYTDFAVFILTPVDLLPWGTDRKCRDETPRKLREPRRAVVDIQRVADQHIRCITVSATDQLYVVGHDYVVTHNTVLAAHLMHQRQPKRSLFIVHRDELIRQTVDKLAIVDPDLAVGVVQGKRNEVDAPVVVASVATLARENRLERLSRDFQLCIIDEAHHATAASYRRVLEHVDDAELILGLTATPQRGDGRALDCFDEITHSVSIVDGIEAGYLADLRGHIAGTDMNLESVTVRGGDFTEGSLGEEMSRSGAIAQIVDAWRAHASDRMTLAFTPTVDTAYSLAESFSRSGIAAEAFDGATPIKHRRAVLDRFHRRQTQVLVNCAVLTEGFDEPAVDCVLLARPTRSPLLYQQIVGRAARPFPGKSEALVLDVTGVTADHDLISLPSLAGLEPSEVEPGQSLAEASEKAASPEVAQRRIKRAQRTRAVDLLSRGSLNWIRYDRALLLPAGEHLVLMIPRDEDGQRWAVGVHSKATGLSVLGADLPVGYASGIGEDYARHCGSLARTNGTWRRQPVSAGQKNVLRSAGLPAEKLPVIRDRGHASDLITMINARPVLGQLRAATGVGGNGR